MYIIKVYPSIPIFGTYEQFTVRFQSPVGLVRWLMNPSNHRYIHRITWIQEKP